MSDKRRGSVAIPLFFAIVSLVLGAALFIAGFFVSNGEVIIAIGGIGFLAGLILTFINVPRRY